MKGTSVVVDPDNPIKQMELWREGLALEPHKEFVRLSRIKAPGKAAQRVLEFINEWGLPHPGMTTLNEVIDAAHQMRDHVELVVLLNQLPKEHVPNPQVVERIRKLLERVPEVNQSVDLIELQFQRLESIEGIIPGEDKSSDLYRSFLHSFRKAFHKFHPLARRDPWKLPVKELISSARNYSTYAFSQFLVSVRPTIGFPRSRAEAVFLVHDLMTYLYVRWFMDLTKEGSSRICVRPNCGEIFRPTRRDKVYCSPECAHAEAMRLCRIRKQEANGKTRGGSGNVRVSKE